jgi:type II secretory pathway pseudopilin PulG
MNRSSDLFNSFFIEMILVILFFAISSAITLQLFVAADSRANQSSDLSAAVIKAQDIAEQIQGISSPYELPEALQTAKRTGSDHGTERFQIGYDRQWNETTDPPRYTADVSVVKTDSESGVFIRADISVSRVESGTKKQIFTLSPAKYVPKTA